MYVLLKMFAIWTINLSEILIRNKRFLERVIKTWKYTCIHIYVREKKTLRT